MARALIVGCGCRGRELGGALASRRWEVRGTSRDERATDEIAAVGIELAWADPDRPGTILELCRDVTVIVWLLGSATGEQGALESIHGSRLERLLERLVETPVRGFVYESVGTVEPEVLRHGVTIVERASRTWRIPVSYIAHPRSDPGWAERAAEIVSASPVA